MRQCAGWFQRGRNDKAFKEDVHGEGYNKFGEVGSDRYAREGGREGGEVLTKREHSRGEKGGEVYGEEQKDKGGC